MEAGEHGELANKGWSIHRHWGKLRHIAGTALAKGKPRMGREGS